mmetsp:Transcript_3697/g.10166  ORF Transcript_3697/g.10166 Transcript_3697/m.10166 type:complete len:225 (+) Transcript_3697:699-1373(+)
MIITGYCEPKAYPASVTPMEKQRDPLRHMKPWPLAIHAVSTMKYEGLVIRMPTRASDRRPPVSRPRLWAPEKRAFADAADRPEPPRESIIRPRLVFRMRPPAWRAKTASQSSQASPHWTIFHGPHSHGEAVSSVVAPREATGAGAVTKGCGEASSVRTPCSGQPGRRVSHGRIQITSSAKPNALFTWSDASPPAAAASTVVAINAKVRHVRYRKRQDTGIQRAS